MLDKTAVEAQVTGSSVSYKPADILKKGKHIAEMVVADLAGNTSEHTWEFSIEETAPSVTDVKPSGTIDENMPIISGKFSDWYRHRY
jgi:hypothetical protein